MREYNGSLRLRGSREADLEGYRVKSDNAGYSFHARMDGAKTKKRNPERNACVPENAHVM